MLQVKKILKACPAQMSLCIALKFVSWYLRRETEQYRKLGISAYFEVNTNTQGTAHENAAGIRRI